MKKDNQTIFSLVTKPINQNVAIIRISGFNFFSKIEKTFNLKLEKTKDVLFKKLYINKKFLDDVLILIFKNPNSFTGEDVMEIQCHGSMFIVNDILRELKKCGFLQAKPGEFTRRAFLNNKIDLSQADAINQIIISENKNLTQIASANLNSFQSKIINQSLSKIEDFIARFQVAIDYPENTDLPKYSLKNIRKELLDFKNQLNKIIQSSKNLVKYSKGIIISLLGQPNVGKSTLFNTLINEEKAIVSDIAGTTRDVVEATMYFKDIKVTFQDTAGHRDSKNKIEKLGILKTEQMIEKSDLILMLLDSTKSIEHQKQYFNKVISKHKNKIIFVLTKGDISKNKKAISSKQNNLKNLFKEIENFISKNLEFDLENSILINENQIDIFEKIEKHVENIISEIDNNNTEDVIFIEMEMILKLLGSLLGKTIDEKYLTNLFSKFCLGK